MAISNFTTLAIVVSNGDASKSTVNLSIPPAALASSEASATGAPANSAQANPGISSFIQAIIRHGFWDGAGTNFYGPASIMKVTPS